MNTKVERIKKITSFLRMQSSPVTVTEIHEALTKRMHLDVSRKTIERDMIELAERKIISTVFGTPSRFSLQRPLDVDVTLKLQEIHLILQSIEPGSELYSKLKRLIE